ncbi:MAG TPA: MmcQ/YjbR family DNA-binding protein [Euzebya sp.]|nr:MmcQ/YjbR family DNA-binding protein [Euzebya sp.]
MTLPAALRRRLLDYALTMPEAYLDHPWGEDVAKVRGKVFVFFGMPEGSDYPPGMTVKLVDSQPLALAQPGVAPSGYNLGKSGWVTVTFSKAMAYEMLRDWIDESYRTVAPKTPRP